MPALRSGTLTAVVLAALAMGAPAVAATCADRPVSARGDPSRFEVVAKAKARGNWRAKVRAMPTLGAAYADFNKAFGGGLSLQPEGGALRLRGSRASVSGLATPFTSAQDRGQREIRTTPLSGPCR